MVALLAVAPTNVGVPGGLGGVVSPPAPAPNTENSHSEYPYWWPSSSVHADVAAVPVIVKVCEPPCWSW